MPTGNLPAEGKKIWEEVYAKAKTSSTCKDQGDRLEECAARVAWKAVHNAGWRKGADGNWHKSSLTEFSLRIERAAYDKATGERRWRAVASDTDEDSREDNMSLELFEDFIQRINSNEQVPDQFRSEFWSGGMPYLSISHYPDLNGEAVPGVIDAVYADGNYLKSKGRFHDTPLGRKCFESVCSELYGTKSEVQDKVRISIAFLDWKHQHKGNGFIFERKGIDDLCSECFREAITGEGEGKIFLRGHLVHLAMTRVPVNKRTDMEVDKSMADIKTRKEDAASIVGEELAEELDEKSKLVGKSEALVVKSEGEGELKTNSITVEDAKTAQEEVPGEVEEECADSTTGEVDQDCLAKKRHETEMSEALVEEATKTEGGCAHPSSHFLVVGDPDKVTTWHLRFKDCSGKVDRRLLGAAKAALTSPGGHRGNKYEGPDKEKAIAKLKRLYSSEKLEWTAEFEEEELPEVQTMSKADFDQMVATIRSTITESINLIVKPVEPNPHPLDTAFGTFRAAYDSLASIEDEQLKLHAVQAPFNQLGQAIVEVIKASVKKSEPAPAPMVESPVGDLAAVLSKAIADAMQPVAQKLDLVSAQLQSKADERVPARRSIQPSAIPTAVTTKSETPKIRGIIERTTL